MRVLFILDSLGAGGAERSTALLLPYLRERGVDVTIALLRSESEGSESEVRERGFPVHVLPHGGALQRVRSLRSLIRAVQPHIVHTSIYSADQLGRIASLGSHTKVVSSLINVPRLRRFRSDFDPPAWKIGIANAVDAVTGWLFVDRFHAVTPGVAKLYAEAYRIDPKRISVVERGRPTASAAWRASGGGGPRLALGLSANDRIVFTAGRQEHQKAHVDLVRAVALLANHDPSIHLLIAGREGNASGALLQEILNNDRAGRFVHLLGHRNDIADLLAAADVMALPSHFEGTAGIVLEAMSIGTPIVATELEGMLGILEHNRNSLVVPARNPAAMAHAIDLLLHDPKLAARLSEAAQVDFRSRFTLDRSADQMLTMYRSVLSGRVHPSDS